MDYFCKICLGNTKKKSKHSHLKSKSHEELEKCKHIILSLKNVDIKVVVELLFLYVRDPNKKFNNCLIKSQFKLVFNNNQDCKYLLTSTVNNTTNISWSNYLRDTIDSLKTEGYDFKYMAEMDIITLAHKRDMTYDFCMKHNMPALEWKLNAMNNKDESIIIKFPQKWRHPINIRFNCYWNIIIQKNMFIITMS